jgi:O-antigen ligase/polysaccharide polymerase Wzy-like membrane protein/tetratricopeptide repeat protein
MRTWILQRYRDYAKRMLIAATFLPPILFWRKTADVFNLFKITVIWVAGVTAVCLWVMWASERGSWMPRIRLGMAAAAFLAACGVGTVFSQNPELSLIGLYHRYGGLIPFLLYAAVMFVMVGIYWERPKELKSIARASGLASILMMTYVLIQASGHDWIAWRDAGGKPPEFPVGTMGNSNFAGGYLGIGVPFLIYTAATMRRDWMKTLVGVLVGADLIALWYTQTRGGMIAGGIGVLAMAFMYRHKLPRWVQATAVVSVVIVAGLAAVVMFGPKNAKPPGPLGQGHTFDTGTFTIRTYYWGTALRIFLKHPIVGTGLESYYANYPPHRLPADGAQLGLTITDKPHSIYLEYAANTGIIGIGSYLVLVGLGLFYGYRRARHIEGEARLLLVAFTATLAAYLGQGVFSIDVPPLAVMGWIGLGGIAAIADPAVVAAREEMAAKAQGGGPAKKKKQKVAPAKRGRGSPALTAVRRGPTLWPVHVGMAVAMVALIVLGTLPVRADIQSKEGQSAEAAQGKAKADVIGFYQHAIRLLPIEPGYRTLAGSVLERQALNSKDASQKKALLDGALERYQQAYNLQQGNIFYLLNIGRVYQEMGEAGDRNAFKTADEWWSRAVAHDPTDFDVHNRYALMLNSWANATGGDVQIRRHSAEELETVKRIKPDFIDAYVNLAKIYLALGEAGKARDNIDGALKIDPNNTEAKGLLAQVTKGT